MDNNNNHEEEVDDDKEDEVDDNDDDEEEEVEEDKNLWTKSFGFVDNFFRICRRNFFDLSTNIF